MSGAGGAGAADAGSADRGTTPSPAALAITPTSKDYSLVVVNSTVDASFDVTNTGDLAAGTSVSSLGGVDAAQFSITAGCATAIAPGGHCTVTVRFKPTTTGRKSATLTVSASPGGAATATLTGTGAAAGALALTPANPGSLGSLLPNTRGMPMSFTVTNTGDVPTSALSSSLSNTPDFTLVDQCGPNPLAAHAICTLSVTFAPSSPGPKSATLAVTAAQGGSASVGLSGTGLRPALLTASQSAYAFGSQEVGVASASTSWIVTNGGDVATSALSFTNDNLQEIIVASNTCVGTLAAGASCTVTFTFKAAGGGDRTSRITLSATTGGSVSAGITGVGLFRLTVTTTGNGTVTSAPTAISCGVTCTGLFAGGTITLHARPGNGSGSRFASWGGGIASACPGIASDCSFTLVTSTTASATFAPVANNLVFLTHAMFAPNLGKDTSVHDAKCNAAATAAGINDATGSGYVALTSSSTSLARTRLGAARGWVRMDGRPYADTVAGLFTGQVMNTILFDETGSSTWAVNAGAATATNSDGTLSAESSCSDWSSTANDQLILGSPPTSGPGVANLLNYCSAQYSLICMGKTKTAAVSPVVTSGRKIWVTRDPLQFGVQVPDAVCQADRPSSGVTTAVALLATTGHVPAAALSLTMSYVRPDGTLVGTGQQLADSSASTSRIESGIWQNADGTYIVGYNPVWTGSATLSVAGTVASTCNNWTDVAGTATTGSTGTIEPFWWATPGNPCGNFLNIFCVQTAP